jgi:hypothetical protein
MKSKHTPGPWRTGWLQSYEMDGNPVSYVYRRPPGDERETAANRIRIKGGDDCDADAALIAAAPEMYEVVERLARMMDVHDELPWTIERAREIRNKLKGES